MLDIIKRALSIVTPSEEERKKAKEVEDELRKRLERILSKHPELQYRFLGSYARNTWLKGNLEFDVFILFPEHVAAEEIERIGLQIGKEVVDEFELRYAAHPYVHGRVKGVEVDIVPCYLLKNAEEIKSAVDRTPFHHDWLKERIKGKEDDVRLLKKFLESSNLYGAEYSVRGFSGYLCELFVIFFGSFIEVVDKCRKLTRDTVIDVAEGKMFRKRGQENLMVVDPVDKKRNVAANLSVDKLAKFVEKCRNFVENPSIDFFVERKIKPLADDLLRKEIEKRKTGLYLIEFEKPDIVEDNLYPQLERACKKIHEFLSSHKFMPLRSAYFVGNNCYLIFETEVKEISRIEKRTGPQFESYENVRKFVSKRRNYKSFVEGGRYFVYAERRNFKAEEALVDYIKKERKSLGKNVGEKLEKFRFLKDEEILELDDNFKIFLAEFLGLVESR